MIENTFEKFNKTFETIKNELLQEVQSEKLLLMQEKKDLAEEFKQFKIIKEKLSKISSNTKSKIKLNVGGQIFTTSLETLTFEKGTFFSAMFSEQFDTKPDEDGEVFIDRDPKHFPLILSYLRNPTMMVDVSDLDEKRLLEFKTEIDYYQIQSLREIKQKVKVIEKTKITETYGNNLTVVDHGNGKMTVTKLETNGWDSGIIFPSCKNGESQ